VQVLFEVAYLFTEVRVVVFERHYSTLELEVLTTNPPDSSL
jgi:hypothetical protein